MSISDIKRIRKWYGLGSITCIILCFIIWLVQSFAPGIISQNIAQENAKVQTDSLICSFLIPLFGGILAEILARWARKKRVKFRYKIHPLEVYSGGIIWLTAGAITGGMLRIMNLTSRWMFGYWLLGSVLVIVGLIMMLCKVLQRKE